MPKETKATQVEIYNRETKIMELLCEAKTKKYIIDYALEHWNISPQQTQNYIKKCYQNIKEESKTIRKNFLSLSLRRRETLYRKALNATDYRLALDIIKDTDKLLGHFQPEVIVNNFTQFNQLNQINAKTVEELHEKFANRLHEIGKDEQSD